MPNKSADKLVQFKGRSGVSVREEVLKVKSVNCSLTVEAIARVLMSAQASTTMFEEWVSDSDT